MQTKGQIPRWSKVARRALLFAALTPPAPSRMVRDKKGAILLLLVFSCLLASLPTATASNDDKTATSQPALSTATLQPAATRRPTNAPHADPAQALLARVRRTYAKRSYTARFSQTYVDEVTGARAPETGTLEVTAEGKVRFAYDGKLAKLFVYDGEDAWFAEPDAAQVTRFAGFSGGPAGEALAFLWGGGPELHNFAAAGCSTDCPPLAPGERAVTFRPKVSMAAVERVDVSVAEASAQIAAVRVRDTLGNETRYVLDGRRFDVKLPAASFVYAPPEGTSVVQALAQ